MDITIALLAAATGLVLGLTAALAVARVRHRQSADGHRTLMAELEARREADRAAAVEALREVVHEHGDTVGSAVDAVVAVAGQKLGDQAAAGAQQVELRSQGIDRQVGTINDELREVRQLVHTLKQERANQQGDLNRALAEAAERQQALFATTQGLRQALASPKARGQWGERAADDILRHAGFVDGVTYRKQTAVEGGGIPDFTFLLPHDQLLHMDVKFPADNYLRHLEAESEVERTRLAEVFLRDVRQRVKELSRRGYTDADDTVRCVLLFIPVESIYGFIHEHDPQLIDTALGQQVMLCSPSSLFAVLAVVRQSIESFVVEQTSDQILECLGGFQSQWDKFTEQMDKVDRQFDTARRSFDGLKSTRRNQLERQLDRIDELRSRRGLDAVPSLTDAESTGDVRLLHEVASR